jgi:PAS domain S-box-containing protein
MPAVTVEVLIVDHDDADSSYIAEILQEDPHQDYRVRRIDGLGRLGDLADPGGIGLVLFDLDEPGRSRADCLRVLQARLPGTPLVALTTDEDPAVGIEALRLGAQDYLVKQHANNEGLRRIVRYSLERSRFQKELERLARYHEMILHSIGEGVVGVDRGGTIRFVNPTAEQLLGWPSGGLIGQQMCRLFCELDTHAGCRSCFSSGSTQEQTFLRKDGTVLPVEATCTVLGDKGLIEGSVVVFRDRTEQIRRQQEIERLRRFYHLILDSAGDGIFGVDTSGCAVFVNRAAEEMLGRKAEDFIGRRIHELIHHSHADRTPHPARHCPIFRSLDGAKVVHVPDDVFWRPDGSCIPVAYASTPIMEEGVAKGAVVVFRDITGQKQMDAVIADQQVRLERMVEERTDKLSREIADRIRVETALRDSQCRLQAITGNLFEGVLVVDVHGHIIFANPSAARLLQAGEGERLAGRDIDAVLQLRSGGETVLFRNGPFARTAVDGSTDHDEDAVFIVADGESLAVAYACAPLIEQDRCRGAIISFRDIGLLKDAQRDAFQASKMAGIGQLAAGIAHEINTPIQYIGDNLSFIGETFEAISRFVAERRAGAPLFDDPDSDRKIDYLVDEVPVAIQQSLEGVGQISRIVQGMKEFSHPGEQHKGTVDINRAVENTLTVCRNEWKHVAEVALDLDPSLPAIRCWAGEINQVLLNLVVNAAHAIAARAQAEPGTIAIRTGLVGDMVEVAVSDDGMGIRPEDRERVFEPFFTTKEVGKGTGQGLAICHAVVVGKHEGQLSFESEWGKGTTFVMRLPVDACSDGVPP